MLYQTTYMSPMGKITLVSDGKELIGLWLENQKYFLGTIKEVITEKHDLEVFDKTITWLEQYFAKEKPVISELPLKPQGSDFRKQVWKILCDIPYGEVITYGDIAKKVAKQMNKKTMSSQAVGGAVGHNPISIIIPCHRVVGTNGSLTGYAGGIDKKITLLKLEGVDLRDFYSSEKGTTL